MEEYGPQTEDDLSMGGESGSERRSVGESWIDAVVYREITFIAGCAGRGAAVKTGVEGHDTIRPAKFSYASKSPRTSCRASRDRDPLRRIVNGFSTMLNTVETSLPEVFPVSRIKSTLFPI